MAGVQQLLHLVHAVALFAVGNVFAGEDQVIDDGAGVRPAAEQIVIFEERVMSIAGVRHHQRLHGNGVLLHQIGNTRVRVNNDFIRQPLLSVLIQSLRFNEFFTKRPVRIVNRHPDAGVSVHHLFRGDDFNLMGIGVQTIEFGHPVDLRQVDIQQLEGPVGSIAQTGAVPGHGI